MKNVPAILNRSEQHPVASGGFIQKWPPHHLVLAVVASQGDRSLSQLSESCHEKIAFLLPESHSEIYKELTGKGLKVPDQKSLQAGRINFDLACMAMRRYYNRSPRKIWRQLNVDASPQGGIEVFGMREVVIENGQPETCKHRTLPLQSLGLNHASLVDKQRALMNAVWLEAGPGEADVRAYCSSVYSITTDLGIELEISDMADVLPSFMASNRDDTEALPTPPAPNSWLFENAMKVPDWSHLWSWLVAATVQEWSWWNQYLPWAKGISKLLTTQSYVDSLVHTLPPEAQCEHEPSLRHFGPRFAKWRFESIASVAKQLARCANALTIAWPLAKLRVRDTELMGRVAKALASEHFWAWNHIINVFSSELERMRQWGLGCKCHEEACLRAAAKHTTFACPLKSMRGSEAFHKLQDFKASFSDKVAELIAHPLIANFPDLRDDVRRGWQGLQAHLEIKFGFLDTMPWLLWRLREEQALATRILAEYDKKVVRDPTFAQHGQHRLHAKFAAPGTALRRHLEAGSRKTHETRTFSITVCAILPNKLWPVQEPLQNIL